MAVNTEITKMQKKVGRPSGRLKNRPFQMRVDEAFLAKIYDWRRKQPDFPNKTQAIIRLVEQALSTGKKR
jgi:hypothetical protein